MQAETLPYYFCETCEKVFLKHDELINHLSDTHYKTLQFDHITNQNNAQDNRDTFNVENGPNNDSIKETVTSEDGKNRKMGITEKMVRILYACIVAALVIVTYSNCLIL